MKRRIIEINEAKCNGCGLCAAACHEGAIGMVDGKAKLLRDDYCDGLGDCLPTCPTGAIRFIEKDTLAYDEAAVKANLARKQAEARQSMTGAEQARANSMSEACRSVAAAGKAAQADAAAPSLDTPVFHGCPGSRAMSLKKHAPLAQAEDAAAMPSQLTNWPVQIKLAPINASYFDNANLLVAADCTAFAYASFHRDFIQGRVTLIGCPKLDMVDYTEKLEAIISQNEIKSLTILRMEVPCCGGLETAAKTALKNSGKFIPWNVVTISTDGEILK